MTATELLKPRFEVINDFPDNHYGKRGTILDRNWSKYPNDDETQKPEWSISDFPHLFRKLEWWEYRDESEMPKKVKVLDGRVFEVECIDFIEGIFYTHKKQSLGFHFEFCLPVD